MTTERRGPDPDPRSGRLRRVEWRIGAAFVVATLSLLSLAVVYAAGGQAQAEGALLLSGLGSLGYGLTVWGKELMPEGPFSQRRGQVMPSEEDRAAFRAAFERGEETVERRSFLAKLALGAFGALGVALLFPIRSLGPRPGRSLFHTSWRPGARLVTPDGQPVPAAKLKLGGVLTVFPEGRIDQADSQVLLIRASEEPVTTRRGRETWSPDGYLAYSKICPHAGCPVGLYEQRRQQLLCPCHQSTFAVLDGARPVFGPATRSLPQLPLAIDEAGFLIAQSDFHEPVGPGFWNRDRRSGSS